MLITMHTNLQGSRKAGVAAANNPDNPGFTSTTALVDRTTQGPVLVLVLVPHFILESTIHVSYFYVAMGSHCRARILHPAGWSLSPPAIPARQANASLARATGHSTETPYPVAKAKAKSPDRGLRSKYPVWRIDADAVRSAKYYHPSPRFSGDITRIQRDQLISWSA